MNENHDSVATFLKIYRWNVRYKEIETTLSKLLLFMVIALVRVVNVIVVGVLYLFVALWQGWW